MNVTSFLYTADPDADEPIMLIDKHIGMDDEDGFGVMGDLFQKELLALDNMDKKRIQIWINSPGGIVSDGYNIYNAILKTKTKVDTYCIGIAASISAVIFQAGRTRYMADYSKLMYHNPYGGSDDKGLGAIRDSIATMISSRTGKTDDEVKKIMNRTTWLGADEALELDFCDEIQVSGEMNAKRKLKTSDQIKDFWQDSNKILNKLFNTNSKNKTNMKNVANRLKLNPEATEESIISEIDRISNKYEALKVKNAEEKKKNDDDMDALNKKVADLEAENKKLKDAADKAEEDKKESAKKAAEKEEADNKAKAKNMVDAFVTEGRIKNEDAVKNLWIEKATVDFEGVKNMIEGLPINGKAVKIDQKPVAGSALANSVLNKMADLRKKQGL